MASEKKLKIQSLLSLSSLPSLPSLPMNKKNLLKPLELSEIIVVMVEQQLSVDKTKQLKSYLTKNRRETVCLEKQEQLITSALQNLPDFAKKQWGETQLLKYHLSRKRPNPAQQLQFYEKKLSQIEFEFSNSLEKYKTQLQQGKNSIEEIEDKVNNLYQTTIMTKHHIQFTNQKIKKYTQRILKNIKKQKNIAKTIAIAKVWSKSNISKILSLNLSQIEDLNITEIMKQMDNCSKAIKIQGESGELQSSDKVLKVIQDRRNFVINKVEKRMLMSIVNFIEQQKYERLYNQYNDLLRGLTWNNQQKWKEYHQLQKQNLISMIQQNVDQIYWSSLEKVSALSNIELLSDDNFTQFLRLLVQNYNNYVVKWHKVTAYHVNKNTEYKDNFLKMIVDVADKIIKKAFHLIKYCQKFYSFSFEHKVRVIIEINKLVEFIEEWTGKKDISLFQVLKQKLRSENENHRKQVNSYIKMGFIDEFTQQSLMCKLKRTLFEDEKDESLRQSTPKKTPKKEITKQVMVDALEDREMIKRIAKTKLFSEIVDPTLVSLSPQKRSRLQPLREEIQGKDNGNIFGSAIQQLKNDIFDLQLSKLFIKSISEYCERQETLPFGHLQCILEHMDLLILLIFKVCVSQETKTKLFEDFSERAFRNLKQVEISIEKNINDESIMNNISKMRESFLNRRNYLELHAYLTDEIGSKFDNIVVSGLLNINKLYTKPEENQQLLNNYHIKVSKLIEEVLKISRWLIKYASKFTNYEYFMKKIEELPVVLIQLGLAYFQQYNLTLYYKYIEKMEPLMKNLKWKIDKFNQQVTLQFREYKLNLLQIYRSSSLNMGLKDFQFIQQLTNKHLQVFYKALLYLYCKIDKINDNGRQVLRLDALQISRILKQIGYNPGSWAIWFEKYIETTMDRTIKTLLQKIEQLGVIYPLYCWKSNVLYVLNNLSSKQKKQYLTHLYHIYLQQFKNLPQL